MLVLRKPEQCLQPRSLGVIQDTRRPVVRINLVPISVDLVVVLIYLLVLDHNNRLRAILDLVNSRLLKVSEIHRHPALPNFRIQVAQIIMFLLTEVILEVIRQGLRTTT